MPKKPVEWRQLCAIARDQIQADPTINNFEWKERIKIRLLAIGLMYPVEPDGIDRALRAVERALSREWGPRPAPVTSVPASVPHPVDPAAPLGREEAAAILTRLKATVRVMPTGPRFTRRQADGLLVIKNIYAPAALESIARCEEYERLAAAAERAIADRHQAVPAVATPFETGTADPSRIGRHG